MTELVVTMGGEPVGVLADVGGRLTFVYLEEWQERAGATPLSVSMPIAGTSFRGSVVEAFIQGLLPDDEAVVRRWAREAEVPSHSLLDVVAHVGEDLPGAMQIVRPERLDALGEPGSIEWLDEEQIAEAIAGARRDHTAWHSAPSAERWSLAGAQAKLALLEDGGRWGRPAGRLPTTHILKPAIQGYVDFDLDEHLCLAAAVRLGLEAARSRVHTFGDERVLVVERYDRVRAGDGRLVRVHQEDLCQALGIRPGAKYENDGGPTAARILRLFPRVMSSTAAVQEATDRFVDALALNWVMAGADAHAKNYSLLLGGTEVRLAPLYDLASVLPYEHHPPKVKLAMKVGGEYPIGRIGRAQWERLASAAGLPSASVLDRVASIVERTPAAFSAARLDLGIDAGTSPLPDRLVDLVADRSRQCQLDL